ncbi:MAG: helix-turn-helix domain-containing protein [Solirubrobacteraceae bacterium]
MDDVAEVLKLNPQTVRNMIDNGELGAVRVGRRRIRVRQSQLDEFLAVGEKLYKGKEERNDGTPWSAVRAALDSVASAVAAEDRETLESAIGDLQAATKALR